MIATILLSSVFSGPWLSLALPSTSPVRPTSFEWRTDDELEARLEAAGDDVAKLFDIAAAYEKEGAEETALEIYGRILKIDPEHEGAHKGLRHHQYDGRWFETYTALSKHRREEARRMLEEHGKVRLGDEWVPQADLPFLRMGWVQDGEAWVSPTEAARREREAELVAEGWQQQDLVWVHPDDFEPWRAGKWKCGDDWLDNDPANAYHADLAQPWKVPGEHFVTISTCDREGVNWAVWHADQAYADLVRIFGVEPEEKPQIVVLRDIAQYNEFAAGNPGAGRNQTEADGFSSLHYSYFAESWFDTSVSPPEYLGAGVSYWARGDEGLAPFGLHAIRHAAAQSFVEAIDPSWMTISQVVANGGGVVPTNAFWKEKRVPRWLRYGAASYVERYFVDGSVGEDGNPLWAREWALSNLEQKGGLGDLEDVFAFGLSLTDLEASTLLIHQAGLVVAYMLDGEDKAVTATHAAWREALSSGEGLDEATEALEKALAKSQKKIAKFGGV